MAGFCLYLFKVGLVRCRQEAATPFRQPLVGPRFTFVSSLGHRARWCAFSFGLWSVVFYISLGAGSFITQVVP